MGYNFTINSEDQDFEVHIDPVGQYGYFEWVGGTNMDPECTGGLWFEKKGERLELVDYDGVFELPLPVYQQLQNAGVIMDDILAPAGS